MLGYYKLCRHYKFALDSIFELYPESHGVIIVEGKLPSYSKSIYVEEIMCTILYGRVYDPFLLI